MTDARAWAASWLHGEAELVNRWSTRDPAEEKKHDASLGREAMTLPEPVNTPELDLESKRLEVRKLNAEVIRAERDNEPWNRVAGRMAPVLSASTTLLAIASLSWTAISATRDVKRREFDSAMTALVSGDRVAVRRAALDRIRDAPADARNSELLRRTLVDQIVADPDDQMRFALQAELLRRGVDDSLLQLLAQQNKELQASFRRRHVRGAADAVTLGAGLSIEEGYDDDSVLASVSRNLGWNIRTLLQAVNKIGTVGSVDFSSVSLSRPIWRSTRPGMLSSADDGAFRAGLRFIGTDFRGANLATLKFSNTVFERADLDSAGVAGVTFDNDTIRQSSMMALRTDVWPYELQLIDRKIRAGYGLPEQTSATFIAGIAGVCRLSVSTDGRLELRDVQVLPESLRTSTSSNAKLDPCASAKTAPNPIPAGRHVSTMIGRPTDAAPRAPVPHQR